MKKTVRKEFVLTPVEALDLKQKAEGACMAEARLLRMLIAGYEPAEKPDDDFYVAMNQLADMGEKIESFSLYISDPNLRNILEQEVDRWHAFQASIERRYLMPKRSDADWL